jgi:hypothetical protein
MKFVLLLAAVLVLSDLVSGFIRKRQIHSLGAGTGQVLVEFQTNFTTWERGSVHTAQNMTEQLTTRVEHYSDAYNLLRNQLVTRPITTTLVKMLFDDSSSFRSSLERFTRSSQVVRATRQKFVALIRNDMREIQSRIIKSASALKCFQAHKQKLGHIFTSFWDHLQPFTARAFVELDARQKNFAHIIYEAVARREGLVRKACQLPISPNTWNISQRTCYANYVSPV